MRYREYLCSGVCCVIAFLKFHFLFHQVKIKIWEIKLIQEIGYQAFFFCKYHTYIFLSANINSSIHPRLRLFTHFFFILVLLKFKIDPLVCQQILSPLKFIQVVPSNFLSNIERGMTCNSFVGVFGWGGTGQKKKELVGGEGHRKGRSHFLFL